MKQFGFWLIVWAVTASAQAASLNEIKAALAEPGKFHLEFAAGGKDVNTVIPLTVITGPRPGPTLLALAGVHGSEYSPIVATQRLAQELQPESLSGSVVLVHMANLPAYLGRTIYTSPIDGKNLNRVFPGDARGTLSERIAHAISRELYPLADAVLDMHSGDGNEQLKPSWTGYYARAGSQDVIDRSRAMAFAFGLPHVVEFQWELIEAKAAIWAGSAAVARGVPSIDVEAGGMGILDEPAIDQLVTGVRRIMAHLGISSEEFAPPPEPVLIRERASVRSPADGSWNPLADAGTKVTKGQRLGFVTDWYGRPIFEARAPFDGLLLLRLEAPPVRAGETLATVARLP